MRTSRERGREGEVKATLAAPKGLVEGQAVSRVRRCRRSVGVGQSVLVVAAAGVDEPESDDEPESEDPELLRLSFL